MQWNVSTLNSNPITLYNRPLKSCSRFIMNRNVICILKLYQSIFSVAKYLRLPYTYYVRI